MAGVTSCIEGVEGLARTDRAGCNPSMTTGYTIRLARGVELDQLPDIERRAATRFRERAGALGLSEAMLADAQPLDSLSTANDDGRLWVAADADDHPVGFALVREIGLFAHLDEIDVLPEHGRQGLGARLIEAVCEWAYTRGFDAVTLSTFRDVPWNAPYYARHGFEPVAAEDLPPELIEVLKREADKGLRPELRVIMRRAV